LAVFPSGEWAVILFNGNWAIRKGFTTNASISVDDEHIATVRATALDANLLVLPLGGIYAYEALQAGHWMHVDVVGRTLTFSLDGTRAAMDAVLVCVNTYAE
jgi:hypothetical protein